MGILEVIIALISAILGGGLWKLLETLFGNSKSLREELRQDVHVLKTKVEALETEADGWQAKAFEWFQKYQMFKLKVYHTMVEHDIPLSVIIELLGEEDQWALVP